MSIHSLTFDAVLEATLDRMGGAMGEILTPYEAWLLARGGANGPWRTDYKAALR